MKKRQQDSPEIKILKLEEEVKSLKNNLISISSENSNLQKAIKRKDTLVNSLSSGIIVLRHSKIININKSMLGQLGYKSDEMIGRNILQFIHTDYKTFARKLHARWISGKTAQEQYEAKFIRKDKEAVPCDIFIRPVHLNNETMLLLNVILIDKRLGQERNKLISEKMDAFTKIASALSQEFGCCFDKIIKYIQAMRSSGTHTESILQGLSKIEGESHKSLQTVRKLDRISDTKSSLPGTIVFELNNAISGAVELAFPQKKGHNETTDDKIQIKTYLRSNASVEGTPREIKHAIAHILQNAADAIPDSGDIFLTTEDNGEYVHIYIQDNGIGIPEHSIDRIFDPFFTTSKDSRTGLGLSLSLAVIKRHNGHIDVSSREGYGTMLDISLPLSSPRKQSRADAEKKKLRPAKIMIIQEQDICRELLAQLLRDKGFKTHTASNILEGLGKIKRIKCDLVIADTGLSVHEIPGFIAKTRQIVPRTEVILITEQEIKNSGHSFDEIQADLILIKPINTNDLVKKAMEMLMKRH